MRNTDTSRANITNMMRRRLDDLEDTQSRLSKYTDEAARVAEAAINWAVIQMDIAIKELARKKP